MKTVRGGGVESERELERERERESVSSLVFSLSSLFFPVLVAMSQATTKEEKKERIKRV
jgi:hypothetical protein